MSEQKKSETQLFVKNFLLGGISAAVSQIYYQPYRNAMFFITFQDENPKIRSGEEPRYSSFFNSIKRVAKDKGIRYIWKDNITCLINFVPKQALNFAFNDFFKRIFCPFDPDKETKKFILGNFASGGAAGASSLIFYQPFSVAKSQLHYDKLFNEHRQFNSLFDYFKKTAVNDGIRGIYQGFVIDLWGQIVYRGLYFGIYYSAKGYGLSKYKVINKFLFAFTVHVLSFFIQLPFQVVSSRLMIVKSMGYKGSIDCFRQIYTQEGVKAFFRGGFFIHRSIQRAIMLVLYDEIQTQINKKYN